MSKFIEAASKKDAQQKIGFDWYKLVKVEGGWMGFSSRDEYETWKKQK